MQKAQTGDGADKPINWHKTKREQQPRKYRRHKKEGRVSKYGITDTLFFGYLDFFKLPEFLQEDSSDERFDAHINYIISHYESCRDHVCKHSQYWSDENIIEQDSNWGSLEDYDISPIQVKLAEKISRQGFDQSLDLTGFIENERR